MTSRKVNLLLLFLLFISSYALAQENSAYTRYGIGDLKLQVPSSFRGSGGIYSAASGPLTLNPGNPASLAGLEYARFDVSVEGASLWTKTRDTLGFSGNANLDHLVLGFPIVNGRWGGAFGLAPFSRVNYSVIQLNDSSGPVGFNRNTFFGSGGINRFFLATGARVGNFSIGVNAAYLFGNITYSNRLEFEDSANAYDSHKQEEQIPSGFFFSAGVQYKLKLGEEYSLRIGVDGNLTSDLNVKRNVTFERLRYTTNLADTVYHATNEKGVIVLPMQLNGGITLTKKDKKDELYNKFTVGLQFQYGKWGDYRSFGLADSTADNFRVSAGVEWIPDVTNYLDSYLNRVRYRFGAYYGTNYLRFGDKSFNGYGITVGLGLPIKRSHPKIPPSLLNLAFDLGQTGTIADNGIKQTCLRVTVGFSLSDLWFVKRKYD